MGADGGKAKVVQQAPRIPVSCSVLPSRLLTAPLPRAPLTQVLQLWEAATLV